jgi:hypothetical protein
VRERIWTLATAAAWLLFCAIAYLTPQVVAQPGTRTFSLAIALQTLSVMLAAGLLLAVLFAGTKAAWSAGARLGMALTGIAGIVLLWRLNDHGPVSTAALGLLLVALALPIGYWLGSQMQRVSHLIPLGVAMAMADVYSVTQGPTQKLATRLQSYQAELTSRTDAAIRGAPPEQAAQAAAQAAMQVKAPLLAYLLVHVPLAGQRATAPAIGIGDLVALAFIFRAAWVHGLNPTLTFWAGLLCTIAALATAQLSNSAVPALPLIAGGMLLVLAFSDARLRKLDRQEVLLGIGVVLLFGALLAAKWISR